VEFVDDGSDGEEDLDGFSSPSGAIRSASGLSVLRLVMSLVAKIEQGGQALGRCEDDVPAIASVAPVRPPAGHEHLAAEAAAAVTAAAGLDRNGDFVDKHRATKARAAMARGVPAMAAHSYRSRTAW